LLTTGNKSDKTNLREVPQYVGEEFARRHDMKFIETSAKEADNVDTLFYDMARELISQTRANNFGSELAVNSSDCNVIGSSTPVRVTLTSCCSKFS
jgi:Ras-related protein Rab-30